jgi:hypothetical protein
MGRPADKKIDVLVSLINNAYAYATGGYANRSRGDVPESPVEKIVGDVFAIVGIEADYSAIKAVQHHIKRRDALYYKPLK